MRTQYNILSSALLPVLSSLALCQAAGPTDQPTVARLDSALGRLIAMHDTIRDMHPLIESLHPVAVVEGDSLLIFDTDTAGTVYQFKRKEPAPFPMQKGIRASFPLSSYGNRPTCVVSQEVFDTRGGYATIFHEFVHCAQALSCENKLKGGLHVARAAFEAKDYSWEINRKFPYADSGFVEAYSHLLGSLRDADSGAVMSACRDLKKQLTLDDYEYLVWVEWKEGLARYVENKIRRLYALDRNLAGRDRPFDRVSFYYGGEAMIIFAAAHEPDDVLNAEKLFGVMLAFGDSR